MAESKVNRKLAAILSADVVGYSKLMADDEAATVDTLKQYRVAISHVVERHKGRVVNAPGDNILAEFASAVEAVQAAVEIQRSIEGRNVELPDERRMHFRVGLNLGDVIEEDDGTIYGDGVNIAARMEALADAGGVCVSSSVHEAVHGKLDFGFDFLGEQQVKNITHPIGVYRVRAAPGAALAAAGKRWLVPTLAAGIAVVTIIVAASLVWWPPFGAQESATSPPGGEAAAALPMPVKPSIAVLPFANLSDDAEQEHFADGITEDLITDLSKINGLFVIARNSSFTYKDQPTKVQEIAEDLGVQYILEGSVRRIGDAVRINAQLIDAREGHHLWAERYEGEASGIFDFQDQVMAKIVANLSIELTGLGAAPGASKTGTDVIAAYDAMLAGRDYFRQGNTDAYRDAITQYEKAIALDPEYGEAYAGLAEVWLSLHKLGWRFAIGDGFRENFDQLTATLAQAKAFPTAHAYVVSAELLARHGNLADALADAEHAITLAPNNPDAYISRAGVLNFLGRAEEAEASARVALRLDPHHRPAHLRVLAHALFHQQRYSAAAETLERVISRQSNSAMDYATLAAAYGHLGETERAAAAVERGNALWYEVLNRNLSVQENGHYWWHGDIFDYDPDYLARLAEGLRLAGVAEGPDSLERHSQYRALMTKLGAEYVVDGAPNIDAAVAKALHDEGATFIDVRDTLSFRGGHVPGAVALGLNSVLSEETLAAHVAKDDDVVFYCFAIYCPYSAYASAKALTWGYTNVFRFDGGYPAWVDAGYPIEVFSETAENSDS
jgi:adenylate cyclase